MQEAEGAEDMDSDSPFKQNASMPVPGRGTSDDGSMDNDRPSGSRNLSKHRSSSSGRPNPWAPLPGPALAGAANLQLLKVQEAAAANLRTMDSLRIRVGSHE